MIRHETAKIATHQSFGAVYYLTVTEFMALVRGGKKLDRFVSRLADGDLFIVKNYLAPKEVELFRQKLFGFRDSCSPAWFPLLDGCPDYHRINDEYEKSRVRGSLRVLHFQRWNERANWFERFRDIFELKCAMAGKALGDYWENIASDLVVPRLTANHYPRGGGYLSEHIDATSEFARVQTIVQLSTMGKDFNSGGVYVRSKTDGEAIYLDPLSSAGDLLLMSPALQHGVSPVDPNRGPIDWERKDGRLMIVPILTPSDFVLDETLRSKMVCKK